MTEMVFTVFDSSANAFLRPFFSPTIETAIRSFREIVNQEGHQFNKFPEDFTLYHVGEFDQTKGELKGSGPVSLGLAITFVTRAPLELEA